MEVSVFTRFTGTFQIETTDGELSGLKPAFICELVDGNGEVQASTTQLHDAWSMLNEQERGMLKALFKKLAEGIAPEWVDPAVVQERIEAKAAEPS